MRSLRGGGPEVQNKGFLCSVMPSTMCAPQEGALKVLGALDSKAKNLRDPSLSSPVCLRVSSCLCELDHFFSCVCASSKPHHLSPNDTMAPAVLGVASIPGLESHSQPSFISTPSSNMSS